MMCVCNHPKHHHTETRCGTTLVYGPASPPNMIPDGTHHGRTETVCTCQGFEAVE